jgi:hypothetical protein
VGWVKWDRPNARHGSWAPSRSGMRRLCRRHQAIESSACTRIGLTPATSAPGLGSPLPHLCRDWAHPCHICTGSARARSACAAGGGLPGRTSRFRPRLAGSSSPRMRSTRQSTIRSRCAGTRRAFAGLPLRRYRPTDAAAPAAGLRRALLHRRVPHEPAVLDVHGWGMIAAVVADAHALSTETRALACARAHARTIPRTHAAYVDVLRSE